MVDTEPTPKTPESLYREAAVLLRKLEEQMPDVALPNEPWTVNEAGKPTLDKIFYENSFLMDVVMNPAADEIFTAISGLFQEAEGLYRASLANESERLHPEVSELIKVYDEDTLHHLTLATTWEMAQVDERRKALRDTTFRSLQTKITEIVKTPEIRDPESRTNPEYDWFWKEVLPQFLKIRSAHGRYMHDVLTHDMPNWTPLLDYCKIASNEL